MADPLSATASCVGVLSFGLGVTQSVLEFYQKARRSRKDVQILCESTEALRKLLEVLQRTINRLGINDKAATVFESVDACKAGLNRLMKKLNKIRQGMTSTGIRSIQPALQYPFRESTVAKLKEIVHMDLMGNLSMAVNILNLDVTSLNYRGVLSSLSTTNSSLNSMRQEVATDLGEVRHDVTNLTTSMAAHQIEDRRDKIIRWVGPSDFVADLHKSACQKRESQTGNWFVLGSSYQQWRALSGSFLWLHGIPGCGKTVLCSTIIEETVSFCSPLDSHYVACYYFTFSDSARQKTTTLLRSLLLQLLRQQLSVPVPVSDLYARYEHDVPSELELLEALKSVIVATSQTYIIIDALDECLAKGGEREKLVALLEALENFDLPNLHILITSRMEPDLRNLAQIVSSPPINIQTNELDSDIQVYVRNQLMNDLKLKCWSVDLRQEINAELVQGARGMFRWVSCQLESLRKCLRPTNVRQTLKTLPKTLDETYDRILLNTDDDYYKESISALTWLLYSERPLWLDEIAELMIIDTSTSPAFDSNERLFHPESALTLLSSLITVTPRGSRKEIHLAHYSVKEYLTSPRAFNSPAYRFSIDQDAANRKILDGCLLYIDCNKALVQGRTPEELKIDFPLIDYACAYWFVHASKCAGAMSENHKQSVKQSVAHFLASKENLDFWTTFFDPEDYGLNIPDGLPRPIESYTTSADPIYFAACVGLDEIVTFLLDTGSNANELGGKHGSALQVASLKGNRNLVSSLLARGADVNAENGMFGNALQAACFCGDNDVVKRIIDAGAHINLRGGFAVTLDAVRYSSNPNPQIVLELLQRGAEIRPGESGWRHPMSRSSFPRNDNAISIGNWLLRWATIEGHEAVVKRMMKRLDTIGPWELEGWIKIGVGVDRNAFYSYQRKNSVLYEAVFYQHERIVRVLLERCRLLFNDGSSMLNVEECDDEGRTALYWASFHRSENIMRLLLGYKADIHAQGPYGWTARYWAVTRKDQPTLDLLDKICPPALCTKCAYVNKTANAELVRLEKIKSISSDF